MSALKYRKKPVVIEAMKLHDMNAEVVISWIGSQARLLQLPSGKTKGVNISTLEGVMTANVGDWIIKGVKGEFYPCKSDIFEASYEPVEPPKPSPQKEKE